MKTSYMKLIVLSLGTAAATSVASAQVGGALRGATGAATGIDLPVGPAPERDTDGPRPPDRPLLPDEPRLPRVTGEAGAAADADIDARRPIREGARAGVAGDAAATGRTGDAATRGFLAGEASATLDATTTVETLRTVGMETRDEALAEVNDRLRASARGVSQLKRNGAKLEGEARAEFSEAFDEVRRCEKDVKKSLKAARKADAAGWTEARGELAGDYEAYAAALARAEVLAMQSEPPGSPNGLSETGAADAGAPAGSDR